MRIESIKNVNITALFSAPFNHLLISQKDLLDLFKTGNQENDEHAFIEAPGLKILIFPKRQKEIVFESNRILINEKTGVEPEKSEVVEYLQKILEGNFIEKDKIAAYGYNYDIVIEPEGGGFKIDDFIGKKFSSLVEIKSAGINISFDKNNIKYVFETRPLKDNDQKLVAHFNAHFSVSELPSNKELKESLRAQFEELKNSIIKKI